MLVIFLVCEPFKSLIGVTESFLPYYTHGDVSAFTSQMSTKQFPFKFLRTFISRNVQGGHGTGKTGNLVITFSRQGKHREFCYNTGKVFKTQGKYF